MEMEEKCRKEEQKKLQEQKEVHKMEVKELESRIEERIKQKVAAEEETERIKEMKGKVEEKLKNTLAAFQNFIDTTRGFNKGQSDFLILDPLKDMGESWDILYSWNTCRLNLLFITSIVVIFSLFFYMHLSIYM